MKFRWTVAACVLAVAPFALRAAPAPSGKSADGPAITFQMANASKLLDDARVIAKMFGGEMAVEKMNEAMKEKLGEKGLAGLDLTRPIAGYVNLDAKKIDDSAGVIAVPITSEEEFLKLLERLEAPLETVKGDKGLYQLGELPGLKLNPMAGDDKPAKPVLMRFHAKHAYFGLNGSAADLDPAKLVAVEKLYDPKETAAVAIKIYNDRYPEELIKESAKQSEQSIEMLKGLLGANDGAKEKVLTSLIGMANRFNQQSQKETAVTGFRLVFDQATGFVEMETSMTPKKGTSLAQDLTDRKPTTNQFAAAFDDKTAAGMKVSMPLFAKELRDAAVVGLEELKKKNEENETETPKEATNELLDGLIRTVKTGEMDLAMTVNGPDKDGHFTSLVAMSYEGGAALEKVLKASMKGDKVPKNIKDGIKFDTGKIGDVNIHDFTMPEKDEKVEKIFGSNTFQFAFGPKAIYVVFGTEAKPMLKKMLSAKPAEAKAFDIVVNPKRLGQLISTGNEQIGGMAAQMLGSEDKATSALYFSVSGGDALKITYGINLKLMSGFARNFGMLR